MTELADRHEGEACSNRSMPGREEPETTSDQRMQPHLASQHSGTAVMKEGDLVKLTQLRKDFLAPRQTQIMEGDFGWFEGMPEEEKRTTRPPFIECTPRIKLAVEELQRKQKRREKLGGTTCPTMCEYLLLSKLDYWRTHGVPLGAAAPSVAHILPDEYEEVGRHIVDLDSEDDKERSRELIDVENYVMDGWNALLEGGPPTASSSASSAGVKIKPEPGTDGEVR